MRPSPIGEARFAFTAQERETETAFELPVELRNDITRLEIASERSAGADVEFGGRKIPVQDLATFDPTGVDIALYCCGAYRAMNKAALNFYETVRREGTQKGIVDTLQTRAELYDFLGYHAYEDKLDALFSNKG